MQNAKSVGAEGYTAKRPTVPLAPPVLSYVPFGAARTSPLSYVAFGAARVSYAGGAAAQKSRQIQRSQNGRYRTVFVPNVTLPVEFSYN